MTVDQNAREFLDYYLSLPGDPEFAVLLEGPWGAGKSHFVQSYFHERLSKLRVEEPDAKDPMIHVTLFGIQDLTDITTQMFQKAHPILGGKAVRFLNNIGSKAVRVFGFAADPKENAALLESMTLNLQDRILVFDDLERSPLPLVEVMGFINQFVEHDKVKVIVIASEDDIPEAQKEEYKNRKEKLIGKTVKVGSEPSEVLDVFTTKLTNPEALVAVGESHEKLLATFAASGRPNFRSLRAVLLDFERLISLTDKRLGESEAARSQLLLHMVALGIEFRSNAIDEIGLRTLQNNIGTYRNLFGNNNQQSPAEVLAADMREKYKHVSFDDPLVRPEDLADLFTSGSIDISVVNKHIEQHPVIIGHVEAPAWRLMWSWFDWPETEYRAARARLVDELTGHKLNHPGQLLHAAGTIMRLKKYDDDLIGGQTVLDYFTNYLAKLEAENVLEPAPELFGIMGGSYAGLMYNEHETAEFQSIQELMAAASSRAHTRRMQATAPDLLAKLRASPEDADMLHEWGLENENYGGILILLHIDVNDFAELALIDGKPNDDLLGALSNRYRQDPSFALAPEHPWLADLCNELISRADALSPPYRAFAKMRLEYWFREI